ncbi:MAG: ADP-ribosylglycohydrolase family protein [Burkholderiales bacterium]|nr:ADP-ribosylglycohydrolase family protein [Burkholderiales bacterium]
MNVDAALADRIRGVVYGHAVGDALGLGTEFMSRSDVQACYPQGLHDYAGIVRDQHRSRWSNGEWTDDTDQMLCILDSLLDKCALDERDVAVRLHEWARKGGRGMGFTTAAVLLDPDYLRDPQKVARRVWSESGKRAAANGAVMRTSVLGVWQFDRADVVAEHAARASRITHADPRCAASCVAVCLLVAGLLEGRVPLGELLLQAASAAGRFDAGVRTCFDRAAGTLESLDLDEGLTEGEANRIGYTYTALEAGLWALSHATSFEDGIGRIVHEGGDADSNGAVAGALLGARFGLAGIPPRWVEGLVGRHELQPRIDRLLELVEHGAASIATPQAHRFAVDALVQRLAGDTTAAELVQQVERVVRYETQGEVPDDEKLQTRLRAGARRPAGRTAIISDIHGNHEGLLAALADIEAQSCDRIVCLGDLVEGGGGNEQVVRTLRERGVPCVRGNHDENNDLRLPEPLQRYLRALPDSMAEGDVLFVHISPLAKKRRIDYAVEAWNVFDECDWRLVFVGHVHVPMIFGERSPVYGEAAVHPFEYNRPFELASDERYIVSVGSIGYGRDRVGRLRYAIHDAAAGTVELRAIEGPLLPLDHAWQR